MRKVQRREASEDMKVIETEKLSYAEKPAELKSSYFSINDKF
jgi:hypothetical protein